MEEKKTSILSNGLIWFGAGISIAEILTGTYIASLGMKKGIAAIILGHVIGCVLLFMAGLIGGKTRRSSMETVKMSFGEKGSLFFSLLNVLQLVGWTAIMIISGARAACTISDKLWGFDEKWVWCLLIGVLIIIWILIGIKNISKLSYIVVGALFILTIILSSTIFKGGSASVIKDGLTFGGAVELSVAMPLSWLPLISDYTREAEKPFGATMASTIFYFAASCWMYIIGMGAAIYTGEQDISNVIIKAGIGLVGVFIVVLSTVTTTFLDAYSAGVSSESISNKLKEKPVATIVCVVGILLAIFTPIENFENFLYLIGSVFAPMIAIQIADYFILKKDSKEKNVDFVNIIIWIIGFVVYRVLMYLNVDTVVGYTLPDMVITLVVTVIIAKIRK